jgi:hypothetical protein
VGLNPYLVRAKYLIKKSYALNDAFKDSIAVPAKRDDESISAPDQGSLPRSFRLH